jgi:hypothetical protein
MAQEFAPVLRARRRGAGLSPRAVAARTGLAVTAISKLGYGRLPPPAAVTIVALCGVLDGAAADVLALTQKDPRGRAPVAC